MDFVVVGFGLGALGILLGVILRGWLAGRCERAAARASDPAVAAYEQANAAECRGAGQAFLAAGGAVVLATVGGLAGGLNDRTGALLVATTATVAALGVILWGYLYRSRHPMPRRPRHRFAAASTAGAPVAGADAAVAEPPLVEAIPTTLNDATGPTGDEEAAATNADERDGPVHTEPTAPLDGLETDAAPEAEHLASAEHSPREVESAANGRSGDGTIVAEDARIVAFVGRGARATTEEDVAVDGDERFDER